MALSPLRRGSNAIKLAAIGNLQRGAEELSNIDHCLQFFLHHLLSVYLVLVKCLTETNHFVCPRRLSLFHRLLNSGCNKNNPWSMIACAEMIWHLSSILSAPCDVCSKVKGSCEVAVLRPSEILQVPQVSVERSIGMD
jgi:hypothetical protein